MSTPSEDPSRHNSIPVVCPAQNPYTPLKIRTKGRKKADRKQNLKILESAAGIDGPQRRQPSGVFLSGAVDSHPGKPSAGTAQRQRGGSASLLQIAAPQDSLSQPEATSGQAAVSQD